MNDRFKFRVWSEEYKMYVEDNHYPIGGDYSLSMTPNGYVEVIGMGDYTDDGAFSWGSIDSLEESAGDCIVEQCTGLKDKNGKLIYEGDLVEIMVWDDIEEDMVETKGKIYWSKEDAAFFIYVALDEEYSLNDHETMYGQEIKVIGNVHENADLLEVNND
jgi:uncharacterized phage protein (TIGR01671 family)